MTSLTEKMEGLKRNTFNEEPFVPHYKPDGMSDEEYAYEIHQHERNHAEYESENEHNRAIDKCKAEAAVVGDLEAELKRFVEMWDKGEFEWNHHDDDEIGKKPVSVYRIWNVYIKPLLAAKDREREELTQTRLELGEALLDMYSQYCQDGHSFMSAGEQASALLERYGYASFDSMGGII